MNFKQLTLAGLVIAYTLLSSPNTISSSKQDTQKNLPKKQICLSDIEGVSFKYDLDSDGYLENISYGDASSSLSIKDDNNQNYVRFVISSPDVCVYSGGNINFITGHKINAGNIDKLTAIMWSGSVVYSVKAVPTNLVDPNLVEVNRGKALSGKQPYLLE